jgi:hypothetical protein
MRKKKIVIEDGYINLAKAIKAIQEKFPWWPETSIRNAVKDGLIPHRRASLAKKSKIFVKLSDLESYADKLPRVDQMTAQSNIESNET